MATADELLSTLDTDKTLIIDKDLRTIIIPSSVKNLGVESDDDVLRLKFSMPRMYGDVDLSDFSIYINYMNAKNTGDVYVVDDKTIADDTITFSWLVGRVALAYKGNVRFIVCMKKHDDDSNVIQEYNTTIASLPVLEGLETGETVIQQNPDIIEMLLTSSEPLVGTTKTITPSQVLTAIKAGRDIALQYTDSYYGTFVFSSFNANEKLGIVVSNSILPPQMNGLTGTLLGFVEDDTWLFRATNTATKDDVGTAVDEALTAAKASGEFDGKSAYSYAVEGGYTGTEAEFAAKLAEEIPVVDETLTEPGKAADAKAVGDAINLLSEEIVGHVSVEPEGEDIPKVYFTGTLPTSKAENDVKLTMHYISKTADFIYPVTLKVQGSSSVNYPKKNFTLKLYTDATYESKKKLAFKNWPEMNKFVLKAHWIDHSHVRNVGTAKIWGKIVKSRSDYNSLPEELRNSPNNGATDGFTVKVFANGVYQGLYEWIVPKDKLFGQDSKIVTHSILNSELNNQPTCAFATTLPTISGNWSEELQDTMSTAISTSFANLIKFVAGSTDEEFVANSENYFDVQSVIDFDIFARVFCIVDNLCRNQIFFTYDGAKWYEGVWDLDAVLGLPPTIRGFFAYNTEFQTGYIAYKDYGVTNLLYQRVETLFMDRFKARYAELRSTVLSIENILDVYERLTDVITNYDGLLAEDYASTTGGGAFTEIPYKTENTIQQIRNFVAQRIPYMDEVIADMNQPVPCTGITLNTDTLTFAGEGSQTLTATVTPDGCTDPVTWESNNTSVATVNGGVVTAVSNGNATITARCGDYSATCAVTVSGIEISGDIIKDGLVMHLDAIDNVSTGHDGNATVWADLSGNGNDATISYTSNAPEWNENGLVFGASVTNAGCIDFTDNEFSVFTLAVCFTAGGLRAYPNDANKLFNGTNFTIDLTKNNTNGSAVDKCLGATHKGVKDIKTTLSTNLDGVNHAFVRFDGANLYFTQNGTTETFEHPNFKLQMSASATSEYDALSNITLHSIFLYDRCLTDNEVSAITNYNAERYGS